MSSPLVYCRISKLGSGSDFEAYFIRLGIASGRARYTKNKVRTVALTAESAEASFIVTHVQILLSELNYLCVCACLCSERTMQGGILLT